MVLFRMPPSLMTRDGREFNLIRGAVMGMMELHPHTMCIVPTHVPQG